MKTLIVVPALNEASKITLTIRDLKKHGYKNILVVDDGSTDKTAEISKKMGVVTVSHLLNRGLGAALGTGFAYAKNNKFDLLVTFDADGQHQASDIANLIAPILKKNADVVIGSRQINRQKMPLPRRFLNSISNFVTFALYGTQTTDSLSGLRAFGKKALNSITIKTDRMEVSNEFFKEISLHHLKMTEISIKAIYTPYSLTHSKQEKLAPLTLGLKMIARLFR